MGIPFADLLGWATIIVEIVGGLMVLVGAFVLAVAVLSRFASQVPVLSPWTDI